MASDALALAAPWRTTVSTKLPLPWLLELNVDGTRVLVTNDDAAGYAWRGPALHADELSLVLSAAEVDRMTARSFRSLLADLQRVERPLTWERVAWDGRDPGGRVQPLAFGDLSLAWALARIGAELVRLEVIEAGGVR